jgi:hypothetical protein
LGDLNSEELVDLMTGQEMGTFCIRFSSSGSLAASFVMQNGNINHVLINNDKGILRVPGNEEMGFRTITGMLLYITKTKFTL